MKCFNSSHWRMALVGALGLLAAACSNPEATRDKYLARGDAAFEKHQYAEAALAYQNALAADPLSAPTRQKLGETHEKAGDLGSASREFIRVADLLPKDPAAQLRAARFLLLGGQFEDAATRTRRALEVEPKNAEAHILLGNAIAGTKDLDGAMKQIQEAIDIDPLSGTGHINMGAMLLVKGRKAEARTSFETAVTLDPRSIVARLALASHLLHVGALKEAEDAVKGALSIDPANAQPNRAMALLLIATGRAMEAEPFVRAAAGAAGTPEAELGLADYYLRVRRTDAAKPILDRLAASPQLFAAASIRLAALDYTAGRKDEGYKRLDEVIAREPGGPGARILKAQWLIADGRPADAVGLAQAVIKADPASAPGHFALGRAKTALGDRAGAEEAFREVVRLNPRAGAAQAELARLSLAMGKVDAGVEFARGAIRNDPTSPDPRVLVVRGLLARRELDQAGAELAPLTRALPDNPTIRALNGVLLALKQDAVGARREYERALQGDPGQIDALRGLTSLEIQAGQVERARQRLGVQLARTPPDAALLLLAAQADLQARDFTNAEQRLRQVITLDPAALRAYDLLAQMYLHQQRLDDARKEFERVAERQSGAVGPLTMVGIIYSVQNRLDDAEKAYRRAVDAGAAAPVAANNLAYMWADRNHNLEEALALARAAAVHMKDNAAVLDTVGWVHYKKGEAELAIRQFEAGVQIDPQNAIYQYHLGLAYLKAGEVPKGKRALNDALRLDPSFEGADEARRLLASSGD